MVTFLVHHLIPFSNRVPSGIMVKYASLLVLLCVLHHGLSMSAASQEVTVMVWNILHGGKNETLPADGRPAIINVIKDSGADVVLMIETYGSAPMISKALGYEYELLSSNLCVFSRYPISKKLLFPDQIDAFNFGGAEISIEGKPVVFLNTWLHYLPDTRLVPLEETEEEIRAWENAGSRDDEIQAILEAIRPFIDNTDTVPIIMGGDFNSHSHLDWTEQTRNMFNHGNAVVEWGISKAMTDAGFLDTHRIIHPDPVKHIGATWLSTGKSNFTRKDRIDYLYSMGKNVDIIASETVVAPLGQPFEYRGEEYPFFPSDHGFVLTTFHLK